MISDDATEFLKPKVVPKGSMSLKDLEEEYEEHQMRVMKENDLKQKFSSPYMFIDIHGDNGIGIFTDVLSEIIESERTPGVLRKTTRPNWYQSTPWGTPRLVDITQVRQLAAHVVFQSCVNVWQSDIRSSQYEIIIDDNELLDDDYYNDLRDLVEDWCESPNLNPNEDIKDVLCQMTKDILEIDAGVGIKHLPDELHEKFDMGEEVSSDDFPDPIDRMQSFVPPNAEPAINYYNPNDNELPLYLTAEDGGSFLKEFGYGSSIVGYWQHPFETTNASHSSNLRPLIFSNREVIFIETNKPTYDNYGWSRAQQVFDVLKFMISTLLNTGKYSEKGALPPGLINVIGLGDNEFNAFASHFRKRLQGNPHQFGLISTPEEGEVKFVPFNFDMDDIILLEPMRFYWKMIMATCQVSASELNITDTVNKATEEEQGKSFRRQRRVVVHNKTERMMNYQIIRQEFDPTGVIKFRWKIEEDIDKQVKIQSIRTQQLNNWERTINEFRNEDGLDPVPWGDRPREMPGATYDLEGETQETEDAFRMEEEIEIDESEEEQEEDEDVEEEIEEDEEIEVDENEKRLIINQTITQKRGYKKKDNGNEENDEDEKRRETSRKIDKLVEDSEGSIFSGIMDIISNWIGRVVDLFKSRFSNTENVTVDRSVKKQVDEIVDSGLTVDELNQIIKGNMIEAFRIGMSVTNDMDIDESLVGISFDVLPQQAIEYLEVNSLLASESLETDLELKMRNEILRAMNKGESKDQIVDRIQSVTEMSEDRARATAQTESINAFAQGRKTRFQQSGIEEFIFYAHLDNRVCEICEEDHEKVFSFENDKDKMPPRHVNCRCTILSKEEEL